MTADELMKLAERFERKAQIQQAGTSYFSELAIKKDVIHAFSLIFDAYRPANEKEHLLSPQDKAIHDLLQCALKDLHRVEKMISENKPLPSQEDIVDPSDRE